MKKTIFFGLAAASLTFASAAVEAATITTLPFWNGSTAISAWGGNATHTYGEVLTAPGSSLTSFTFEVNDGGSPANYVAQVYAWSGSTTTGGPVGAALYTGAASILPGFSGFQAVTTNTGGVAVTPGQRYSILLFDGSGDGVRGNWGRIAAHPGVVGDVGFFFNNGPSNANGTFNDFGSLAYSATFTNSVPEPTSWALMLMGFGSIGAAARSGRRKQAAVAV